MIEYELKCPQCGDTIYYESLEDDSVEVDCPCGWSGLVINGRLQEGEDE